MKTHILNISEMIVLDGKDDVLYAYSLSSCLAVIFYDTQRKIGGMVNCMLPLAQADKAKAEVYPGMFVDSGVRALLDQMLARGCKPENLKVKMAGAANIIGDKGWVKFAERNVDVFEKMMEELGMQIHGKHIGGHLSKSIRFEIHTGNVFVIIGENEVML